MTIDELSTDELAKALAKRQKQERELANKKRSAYEKKRDKTTVKLCTAAKKVSAGLRDFKEKAFADMEELYAELAEYSKRHADKDGSFAIESADGRFKITYRRDDNSFFDERSEQAERHIVDFLNTRYNGDQDTRDLISSLMERTKGKLDIKLVSRLYSMESRFNDANWIEGIKLLKESFRKGETKHYINFYERVNTEWQYIPMAFSKV